MEESFSPDRVTFYGRSMDEYELMFMFNRNDLVGKRILDCPSGPASFVAQCSDIGIEAIGVDPMYAHDSDYLEQVGCDDIHYIVERINETSTERKWSYYSSPDDLLSRQNNILRRFLDDYRQRMPGSPNSPYVNAALPNLPFKDQEFDLVLSSHFLFSFHSHHGTDFTIAALKELTRVAREVRVTPLRTNEQDRDLDFYDMSRVLEAAEELGLTHRIEEHRFEFQVGANQLLTLTRS